VAPWTAAQVLFPFARSLALHLWVQDHLVSCPVLIVAAQRHPCGAVLAGFPGSRASCPGRPAGSAARLQRLWRAVREGWPGVGRLGGEARLVAWCSVLGAASRQTGCLLVGSPASSRSLGQLKFRASFSHLLPGRSGPPALLAASGQGSILDAGV